LDGGVGSLVEVAGGNIGEISAPLCGARLGGVSGLQPTAKNNARNSNITTHVACLEKTAMFDLL
jgi:hypothetical protein